MVARVAPTPVPPYLGGREDGAVPADPFRLTLSCAGGLVVHVRDEAREPVGGDAAAVKVEAFAESAGGSPVCPHCPCLDLEQDSGGSAGVPWLGLGLHLRVILRPRDGESLRRAGAVEVTGPRQDEETVTCEVGPPSQPGPGDLYQVVTGGSWSGTGAPGLPAAFDRGPLPPVVSGPRHARPGGPASRDGADL